MKLNKIILILIVLLLLFIGIFKFFSYKDKKEKEKLEVLQFKEVRKLNNILIQDMDHKTNILLHGFIDLDSEFNRVSIDLEHESAVKKILSKELISLVYGNFSIGVLYDCSREDISFKETRITSYLFFKGNIKKSEVYSNWLYLKKEKVEKLGGDWYRIVYIERSRGF